MKEVLRLFDSNTSFVEGRQTELVAHKRLESAGFIVSAFKANQKWSDIVLIEPNSHREFLV